jgi:N-acetylmuramoyl-L-alanine amidase
MRRSASATAESSHLSRLCRLRSRTALSGCALAVVSPFMLDFLVRPGDTVTQIAAEHDTSVDRVVDANDLPAGGDRIYAGEVLRVPAAHRPGHRRAQGSRPGTAAATTGPSRTQADGRRRIEWHRVEPGDTMTGIAERYHAWTDELVAANGGGTDLHVGERLRVPVVVAAADDAARQAAGGDRGSARIRGLRAELSTYPDPSRPRVRRIIERVAHREGVDADLALAVSWQEAGWRQHHVSPDAAIGAMQVIPSTGAWVGDVVGRELNLMRVRENVTAGVVLLDELTDAAHTRRAVAGYYQGLAGVQQHGMYDDTRAYVDNVMALKRTLARGDHPG